MIDELEVHVSLGADTVLAGRAQFHRSRGRFSSTTFQYDPAYIAHPASYSVDPGLSLAYTGTQHVRGLPGAFSDCAPDRWGRNLISKRERETALAENRRPRTLDDVDYLGGAHDLTRRGALRFRLDSDSPFLEPDHGVPKLLQLPELMRAADVASRDTGDSGGLAALKLLLNAGTGSLGGSRPKAAVRGDDGELMTAKFPHHEDEWDVMAWEATALDLAAAAGISVPQYELITLEDKHVLLLARFDRDGDRRIGYVSAMTLLEKRDGAAGDYEYFAEAIEEYGSQVKDDLTELFRLAELAIMCRVDDGGVERERIAEVLSTWKDIATRNGVPGGELSRFAPVFERGIDVLRR